MRFVLIGHNYFWQDRMNVLAFFDESAGNSTEMRQQIYRGRKVWQLHTDHFVTTFTST